MTKTSRIIVLNDGETFTTSGGCVLLELPSDVSDAEIKRAAHAAADSDKSIIEVLRDDGGLNVFNIEVIARF